MLSTLPGKQRTDDAAVQVVLTRGDVSLCLAIFWKMIQGKISPLNEHQKERLEGQRTRAKFLVSGVGRDDRLFGFVSYLSDVGEVE